MAAQAAGRVVPVCSQRVTRPVVARVNKVLPIATIRAMVPKWATSRASDGSTAHSQGGASLPMWLASAAASHTAPVSGPAASKLTAVRLACAVASSARNPAATRTGLPNSSMAKRAARTGSSPAPRCVSAASATPAPSSARMSRRAAAGPDNSAAIAAR